MRVVTWNLNGIRAAYRKGMDDFVNDIDADIWLFQEVRALPEQMPENWTAAPGHEVIWHPAEKKGYSGVSTWSRVGISEQGRGISTELDPNDSEGRVLHTKHGELHCINIYLPNNQNLNLIEDFIRASSQSSNNLFIYFLYHIHKIYM